MSTRGIWQLKKLQLYYAEHNGSSKGVREFLSSGFLSFANANPHISLEAIQRGAKEPHVIGHYVRGPPITVGLKNADPTRCSFVFSLLRNRSNRPGLHQLKLWPGAKTEHASVQGKWSPLFHYTDS